MSFKILRKLKREILVGLSKTGVKRTTINRNGIKFIVPIIYGIGRFHIVPRTEPWMDKCLQIVSENWAGSLIDVGANVGQFLLKAKEITPTTSYYGFEPNPPCIFYLYELLRLNSFQDTYIFPFALSNQNRPGVLFSEAWDSGTSTLLNENTLQTKEYSTTIYSFHGDMIMDDLHVKEISFIKLDVEGFEFEVLKGLRKTLKEKRPFIFCEILTKNHTNDYLLQLHSFMKDLGFEAAGAGPNLHLEIITQVSEYREKSFSDYLFIPREDVSKAISKFNN